MNRRKFLGAVGAGAAIGVLDWLKYFKQFGIPGSKKTLGVAEAIADTGTPHFLLYWFIEGGWDGYSMFNPLVSRNDAPAKVGGTTAIYRPAGNWYDNSGNYKTTTQGTVTVGHLASGGLELIPDMSIVSSHKGGTFHSGSRLNYHYGTYASYMNPQAQRNAAERTVMQAFCEEYGAAYLLPHLSFHRWLSDGELAEQNYPEGTGYYEKLGPPQAHTIYAGTPAAMRSRITQIRNSKGSPATERVHKFVDNLYGNFMKDKNGESVRAFDSAVKIHQSLSQRGSNVDPATLFSDATLRGEFGVTAQDELTSAQAVNNMPARSKNSPNTNVQAMMAFEMITRGLSIAAWIESRDVRGFDSHRSRSAVLQNNGQYDQKTEMDKHLWTPLKALVKRLKSTQLGTTGKSYWDSTTIVLASEMGRSVSGEDDDVCKHWEVSSVAFLGGPVKGGTQFGKVGKESMEAIPTLPDGTLDPNFDAVTGRLLPGKTPSPTGFISDAGHVYSTALALSGITTARGMNVKPALNFVKK